MLVNFDLAGAEWVVVAFLADDPNMIDVVRSGKSPHVATGVLVSRAPEDLVIREHKIVGDQTDPDLVRELRRRGVPELLEGDYWLPRSMSIRQACKKANHGLNYDMRYRRFALENEMAETDAKPICDLYHDVAYPNIRRVFHADVLDELKTNDRTLENLMQRRVRLLDQNGPDLWNKAYSFKPQSTVADIIIEAMCMAYEDHGELFAPMKLKANVYDSLLVDYPAEPREQLLAFASAMQKLMSPILTAKGHNFTLGVDVKTGHNWGEMTPLDLKAEDLPEEWDPIGHGSEPLLNHLSERTLT